MIEIDKNSLSIQLMSNVTINQVLAIEQQVHLSPWSVKKIRSCFDNELTKIFGCFYHEDLIGYAVLQVIEPDAELQNFAIAKRFQQKGIGRHFLGKLIQYCQFLKLDKIMLEVRESNAVASRLYQKNGFEKVGERKDYYLSISGKESAILMTKIL